jgi:hypothetical protein
MLIKDSIDKDIFSPYKEDEEEDLEVLMWELEELNKQNPKNGSNSWDL